MQKHLLNTTAAMPKAYEVATASPSTKTERFLRRPAVEDLTGYKTSAIYQKMHDGTFPKAVKLGANRVGWIASEIYAWMDERIAESRTTSTKAGA